MVGMKKIRKMTNVVLRIKEYIDYKCISISAFEKSIGMSNASFGKSLKNGGSIGSDKLERILNIYTDLCPIWLMTGQGNMLSSENNKEFGEISEDQPSILCEKEEVKIKSLPYYDKDMVECCDTNEIKAAHLSIDEYFSQHADLYCTCCEHSMSPAIRYGDILALKEIKVDNVIFGEIYAIVMESVRLIRQIKSSHEPHLLTFIPFNSDFEPQIFKKAEIQKIYRVVGSVHRFS